MGSNNKIATSGGAGRRLMILLNSCLMLGGLAISAPAQYVGFQQAGMLRATEIGVTNRGVNYSSGQGVAIPASEGTSNGMGSEAQTPGQFQGILSLGGAAQAEVDGDQSYNLLRVASGMPYYSRTTQFLFGSIITPPTTDVYGTPLDGQAATNYWHPEPFVESQATVNDDDVSDEHDASHYYWSRHAGVVFASRSGQIRISWRTASPDKAAFEGNGELKTYEDSGNHYAYTNQTLIVAGTTAKPARTLYWTKGAYEKFGKPVTVPSARVRALEFAYTTDFPDEVAASVEDLSNGLEEKRTIWFDGVQGQIHAYNQEGRIFMELLGDVVEGDQRQHLGFEIIDVVDEVTPVTLTVELGEAINAGSGSSADLRAEEVVGTHAGQEFLYRHVRPGSDAATYYAVRETENLNDVLVHWMEEGTEGIWWPSIFARYDQGWPVDIAKYSHYVRPPVSNVNKAKDTAVILPQANAPTLVFQDLDSDENTRAYLEVDGSFYTSLDSEMPAHRSLLRYHAGEEVAFERVFSWFSDHLAADDPDTTDTEGLENFDGTVAAELDSWDGSGSFDWVANWSSEATSAEFPAPRVVAEVAPVGERITAPAGESAGLDHYLAGHINIDKGTAYDPTAYIDPLTAGVEAAKLGAILPVNAVPTNNVLEVVWLRAGATNAVRNAANGFGAVYWPAVIGRYTLTYAEEMDEIVLASNRGSGPLDSLQSRGSIYGQNDADAAGYNPNEEHALMIGGQAYALRDDLNVTGDGYTSEPVVLLRYTNADGRPAMRTFRVQREKPEAGLVFDYAVQAGTQLQAPMPLPLLPAPTGVDTDGVAFNYNTEITTNITDTPEGWDDDTHAAAWGNYQQFTYRDRKENYWVLRGRHAGPPELAAGTAVYDDPTESWAFQTNLPAATARLGKPFDTTVHASRPGAALVLSLAADSPPLPAGLSISGLRIQGVPNEAADAMDYSLVVAEPGTDLRVTVTLNLAVLAEPGMPVGQAALEISYTNAVGEAVTLVDRPPYLAEMPGNGNSFSMRFYYQNQSGFHWPSLATTNVPAAGQVVPYLRAASEGDYLGEVDSDTEALEIIYRPYWPTDVPVMAMGQTLMEATAGLPAVRGQTSVEVLYQQSIAAEFTNHLAAITDPGTGTNAASVVLHDPTREKTVALTEAAAGLAKMPVGVNTEAYQGRTYFPNLPPHLVQRFYFDPNRGALGSLVLGGEFVDELTGEKYLHLNVLRGSDLEYVQELCPEDDEDRAAWDTAIAALASTVETFREDPTKPGTYVPEETLTVDVGVGDLAEVDDDDTAVDSYALSAGGPGSGYVTLIVGDGEAFTPAGEPVSMYVLRVEERLHPGELKILAAPNPLNEYVTLQHTPDLAGRFADYEYEWKLTPPVDGQAPVEDGEMSAYQALLTATNQPRYVLGASGVQSLVDNWIVMRYRPKDESHPLYDQWSDWTRPQLAEGWIKRVLAGINPFNQRVSDLYNNAANSDVSLLVQAGRRWEGDIALNQDSINDYGLIEIYETVLRRGKALSLDAGINFGAANDALLLAAGYLNDLYILVGDEAWADAANPTIGIGTADRTYGDVATALFSFRGQVPTLLEEELGLLRGRDSFPQPGVEVAPVYNRLYWNTTRGIDAGETIYQINYNLTDKNDDAVVDEADAAHLYPQGHGDAYGHYLTALKGYYSLLIDSSFDWVPQTETVTVLGQPVSVDYSDERKFAAAAAAVARTGRQITELTWRRDYSPGEEDGWEHLGAQRETSRQVTLPNGETAAIERHWGVDQWTSRTLQGTFLNWVVGNAILPDEDEDPTHEGIQKIDRTTVPELKELAVIAGELQISLDNCEGRMTPLGLAEGSMVFDLNPHYITGDDPKGHYEQVYGRAQQALQNAVTAFDDAKDVTQLMRSEQDSVEDYQNQYLLQELAYTNALIEIYGTPYPDDIGAGKTYPQGYAGPDLLHYTYVDLPEYEFGGPWSLNNGVSASFKISDAREEIENLGATSSAAPPSGPVKPVSIQLSPLGFAVKPAEWKGQRLSPGELQQAYSEIIMAHQQLRETLNVANGAFRNVGVRREYYESATKRLGDIVGKEQRIVDLENLVTDLEHAYEITSRGNELLRESIVTSIDIFKDSLPESTILGFSNGGDLTSVARSSLHAAQYQAHASMSVLDFILYTGLRAGVGGWQDEIATIQKQIFESEFRLDKDDQAYDLAELIETLGVHYSTINQRARALDDAQRRYRTVLAKGEGLRAEREVFRERAATVIQGFRTRDVGFRIFREEKLERYKALFDLAARYTYLAANAYDYETGLLNTTAGKEFVQRIINSRALGVMIDGQPQFAGSNTGDPGLSGVLAEMNADWQVLKGRLGFNHSDAYGTTVSLRTENHRILPDSEGDTVWTDVLESARRDNILEDADVLRHCMRVDPGNGLPVPGIILEFSTTIANGLNLFGRPLAAGDHDFSPAHFATKIYSVGVAIEGYQGMDTPTANQWVVGGDGNGGYTVTPPEADTWFLDPDALAATPDIYLIPVGVDAMRSPPLGDAGEIRTWNVRDVTLPLPFNIGASEHSTKALYTTADSLSEPLFGLRKHQPFRPVPSTSAFGSAIYNEDSTLRESQYTNGRLIGRSVWNSRWKLVIPGYELLNDPDEGLERFIRTVTDIKLAFLTYSYAGN